MKTIFGIVTAGAALLAVGSSASAAECVNGYMELGNGLVVACDEPATLGAREEFGRPLPDAAVETDAAIAVEGETVISEPGPMTEGAIVAAEEEAVIAAPVATTEQAVVVVEPAPLPPEPAPPIEEPLLTGSIATESAPDCVNGYMELGNGVVMVCDEPMRFGAVDEFGRPIPDATMAPETAVITEPDGMAEAAMVAAEPAPLPPEPAPIEEPLYTGSIASAEQNEVAGQIPDAPPTTEPAFTTVADANEPEVPGRIPFDGSPAAESRVVMAESEAECRPGLFWESGGRVLLPCLR
jgi:hypothetical protein